MKILILDEKNMPFYDNRIQGGIQYVVKSQYNLLKSHHDVKLFVTKDSEFNDDNIIPSELKSRKNEEMSSIQYNRKRNEEIIKLVNLFQPDVIINHDQSNNSLTKTLYTILNEYPSITVCHNACEVIGGIAGFSYITEMSNLKKNKKLILNVSETSMKEWNVYSKKYGKGIIDSLYLTEDMFENFHYNYYTDPIQVEKTGDYFLMISRISSDKKIHIAAKYCQELNVPFMLCYTPPRTESEIEYFESLKDLDIIFKPDLPRKEVLVTLSMAKGAFICGPESFGLVAAEANTYGVPVILISTKTEHPSIEISNNIVHLNSKNKKENLETLSKIKDLEYDQKLKLSNEFVNKFSKKSCFDSLIKNIDLAISLNTTKKTDSLLDFFN